ncbi:ADP-ribosyl cyclase/cyclic ADP-ribose hydrolase 2, partial [Eschrichtius robustus]|nr:ADP-ribosyl cyclase/cyclic ADP-ribose hydrolase 2 [Eschrichtius robustus]
MGSVPCQGTKILQAARHGKKKRDKNCTAIWEAFKLVLDKDPCSVLPSDYDLFINLSRHSIPRDKLDDPTEGLDYQSCPTSEDCENNPVDSYWKSASIQYAKDSSGVIYVMLNGSEPTGAYPVKG